MSMRIKLILLSTLACASTAAHAFGAVREIVQEFGIKTYYVSREEQDLYDVSLNNMIVKTRYCYEYAFSSEAIITDRKIIFVDSETICDVEGIYRKR